MYTFLYFTKLNLSFKFVFFFKFRSRSRPHEPEPGQDRTGSTTLIRLILFKCLTLIMYARTTNAGPYIILFCHILCDSDTRLLILYQRWAI